MQEFLKHRPELHFYSQPNHPSPLFQKFNAWPLPILSDGPAFEAHAFLGRALALHASKGDVLPLELLDGLLAIASAREGKGRRSKDWLALIPFNFSDTDDLISIRQKLTPHSPPTRFLDFAIDALQNIILPPPIAFESGGKEGAQQNVSDGLDSLLPPPPAESRTVDDALLHTTGEATEPDISVRLAAADYSGFAEKMGLHHRDQMLVDDLADTTVQLARALTSSSKLHQGFALLAIFSLITGCTDEVALDLKLHQSNNSIWIDPARGAWGWDFNVYRQSEAAAPKTKEQDPVYCPLPSIIDPFLAAAMRDCPAATTLREMILQVQQVSEFDLTAFRQFLRSCSHPAHPAHRGRFARSLPAVYLQTSGSDMTSGLMAGFFASTAPAALFYFGPRYSTLVSRVATVYELLGLGSPSHLFSASGRAGCHYILETTTLHKGWAGHVEALNACRKEAFSATDPAVILNTCNRWIDLLCAALVAQTGHRGTRIECLTAGALYSHPQMMCIQDKDEGGRAQPRLLPKTTVVLQILESIVECHRIVNRIAQSGVRSVRSDWDLPDPVFVHWASVDGIMTAAVLATSAIVKETNRFFQARENFGRSQWVTYLDENRCDRWLIRALTGHTRDVTRVQGAYFDIPAIVVANRLCREMEKTGRLMFGEKIIETGGAQAATINLPLIKPRPTGMVVAGPLPDPRTLLEPLTTDTLFESRVAEKLRLDLVSGNIDASLEALVVLHLVFIDLIPDTELCLAAVLDRPRTLKTFKNCTVLQWARAHFVHPTCMPLQPSTTQIIKSLSDSTPSRLTLLFEISKAIRSKGYARWPGSDSQCWNAINTTARSFRRVYLPPSINAVSHFGVAAPCLSAHSMDRLAGTSTTSTRALSKRKPVRAMAARKTDDARFLVTTLGKYASSIERLGEKRVRAIKCMEALGVEGTWWTPFVLWIRKWCEDELRRSRDRLDGCYQISSILTYTTTLLLGSGEMDVMDDPCDWEDAQWAAWIAIINKGGAVQPTMQRNATDGNELTERVKNAAGALVRSLIRRKEYVPLEIRIKVGLTSKTVTPGGSACACLISLEDQTQALEISKEWNVDYPGDQALLDLRSYVCQTIPLRKGDVSSLAIDCLTPAGGLVIKRVGYDVHKNQNAVRVVQLNQDQQESLRTRMKTAMAHFGERSLLLRGHGSTSEGLRDDQVASDWADALKLATADPSARPHSVRAATLQQIAWPGWIPLSRRVLDQSVTPSECQIWVDDQQKSWCRLSLAVAMAGQGDLRSALGNYLAGWPLVYSIHASASLANIAPGPGFLMQLGLMPATLRQAKSRHHRRADGNPVQAPQDFDTWGWISKQVGKQSSEVNPPCASGPTQKKFETPLAIVPGGAHIVEPVEATTNERLIYLTLRMLGVPPTVAVEKAKIRFRAAEQLEPFLPVEPVVASAIKRDRKGPEARGLVANISMALSDKGLSVLNWLFGLESATCLLLKQALFRDEPTHSSLTKVMFWRRIAESLPAAVSIRVRIGSKHLTVAEQSALLAMGPAVLVSPDPRLGERPVISVHMRESENLVISARLTAVTRIYALAIDSLNRFMKPGERDVR
jgi:hypothetical protein